MRIYDPDDPIWNEDEERAAAHRESREDWAAEAAATGPECINCNGPTEGYACEQCEEPCCEACLGYLETVPATRIDPADGVSICPECEGRIEAGREEAELRAAEDRAWERAADREYWDDVRW